MESNITRTPNIGPAIICMLKTIIYVLFLLPYDLWVQSVNRLAALENTKGYEVGERKSHWPLLSYQYHLTFEYCFDIITILVPVYLLVAFIVLLFKTNFGIIILTLYGVYMSSVAIQLIRDFIQLVFIAPIRKFVSWLNKPAQYLDIKMDQDLKVKK